MELGRQIAKGYLRDPPDAPDEWGDLSRFTDHATADLLAGLDLEEQAVGRKPW